MKINLHTHSNFSLDGEYSVNELIDMLDKNGFEIISITDHDSCEVYKHIDNNKSIKVITGMEADAIVNNHTYDFLCYGFDIDEVYNYTKNKYKTVNERQRIIFNELVNKCNLNNIKLSNIDSYDDKKEYAHSAIYRMLDDDFKNKYNINTASDLYRIGTTNIDFPLYIDMHIVWPDINELVELIHKNNGKVFIAHPYRYNKDVNDVLNDVINYVDGIEICNNPKDKDEVEYLYNYAKSHNKLVSCGSDYHGDKRFSMNCDYLTDEMINDVLSWINNNN